MENNVNTNETTAQNTNEVVNNQPQTVTAPADEKSLTRKIIEGVVERGVIGLAIFGGYVLVRGIIGGASGAAEAASEAASSLR